MKKIICSVLCLIMAMFMFVSCAEDVIGEYIDQYEKPTSKEVISLNLYIVYEEGTASNALDTVKERIKTYTNDTYDTPVSVFYCSKSEYESKISEATAQNATDKADIFLITSKSMFDTMYAGGLLADLTTYIDSKTFGTLNAQIASSLMEASLVERQDANTGKTIFANYCVPNNRVVGGYDYLLIKRDTAEHYYMGSAAQLAAFTTEESVAELKQLIEADIANGALDGELNDHVRTEINGKYEDKAYYESIGYACNTMSYPEVTKDYVYQSVFAVNNACVNVERAMEIIYAINTDTTLRNYLQYGIAATNYTVDDDGVVDRYTNVGENDRYIMNSLYTGDIFKMLYCNDQGLIWTAENATNGAKQNKDSVIAE